jgi:hypothetical protein
MEGTMIHPTLRQARLMLCASFLTMAGVAKAVPVFSDFESVDNIAVPAAPAPTDIGAVTTGIALGTSSEINDEFGIFRITSGAPASDPADTFGGIAAWVNLVAPRSAHSGSRVVAGATLNSVVDVDFTNFIEIRILDPGYKTVKLWVGSIDGGSATMLVTDDVNGGNTLSNAPITLDGFAEFTSPGTDIRRVVLFPGAGTGIWIDDLSVDTAATTSVPAPSGIALLAPLVAGIVLRSRSRRS